MNPAPEDFDRLRKLLALKRHEQPPLGYYSNFSHNVLARINAEEGDAEGAGLLKFWRYLTLRPLLSGFVGAGVCGFLAVGLMLLREPDTGAANTLLGGMPHLPAAQPASFLNPLAADNSLAGTVREANSTNPVISPLEPPSLFTTPRLHVDKASFNPGQ